MNGSPQPAAQELIIIPQDKGVLQVVPSFVNKFADNLQRFAKAGDGRIVLQMYSLLFGISFEVNPFQRYIKALHIAKKLPLQIQSSS